MYSDSYSADGHSMPVTAFISMYTNKKTISNYTTAILNYLRCFDPHLQTLQDADSYAADYLRKIAERNRKIHDLKYAGTVFTKNYSPTTAHLYLTIVCIWLEDNGIALSARERRHIFAGMPPPRPVREEIDMEKKLFQTIYRRLPDWTAVLLLLLLGSGMRIGEAMALTKSDINWKGRFVSISLSAEKTKTKTARQVYITTEAAKALKTYLAERTDTSERIFPYTTAAAQYHLRKAIDALSLTRTGQNGDRKIRLIHWHMTRKWFISRFSLAAGKHIAEHLAGHEGYLDAAYFRYSKKEIETEYAKAEKYLSIL